MKLSPLSRLIVPALGSFLFLGGCNGKIVDPSLGSESHFLTYCSESCGDGFACIGGICTETCVVAGEDACGEIHSGAICTNESVEPGSVAVCDMPCTGSIDCGSLSPAHACFEGFCRGQARKTPSDFFTENTMFPSEFDPGAVLGSCDPLPAPIENDPSTRCAIMEINRDVSLNCQAAGRRPVSAELAHRTRQYMAGDACESATGDCKDWSMCEIDRVLKSEEEACISGETTSSSGYCQLPELESRYSDELTFEDPPACEPLKHGGIRLVGPTFETGESIISWIGCGHTPLP